MVKSIKYKVNLPLAEVWEETINFWSENEGDIRKKDYNYDDSSRILYIHHAISHISWGEHYKMIFTRIPNKPKKTKVIVIIKLSFDSPAGGAQWKKPSDLLKKWASEVGIMPIDFGKRPFLITWVCIGTLLGSLGGIFIFLTIRPGGPFYPEQPELPPIYFLLFPGLFGIFIGMLIYHYLNKKFYLKS